MLVMEKKLEKANYMSKDKRFFKIYGMVAVLMKQA